MYHIQTTEAKTLPNYNSFPNTKSVEDLWLKTWKTPCSEGSYPFMEGSIDDFEPIFQELIKLSDGTLEILYDPDRYAAPFMPVGDELVKQAVEAESAGDIDKAKEFYLRAAAVYRISRWPIIRTKLNQQAWQRQKDAFKQATRYMTPKFTEIDIPFTHADRSKGDMDAPIPAYLRLPEGKPRFAAGHPPLLFLCGIDGYRVDTTSFYSKNLTNGFAIIVLEIPGTGDCPASKADPESPDRLLSSVLDWVHSNGLRYDFDLSKICMHGVSTGGYSAMRAAHTHAERLFSVMAHGGGSHHMFDGYWIRMQDQMEYPFGLAEAFAYKFGYDTVEDYAKDDHARARYSLIDGHGQVANRPSCRMLIINGMEDSLFPCEDSMLVAAKGWNKDLYLAGNLRHMGYPASDDIVNDWLLKRANGMP